MSPVSKSTTSQPASCAFTLLELLVVLAIIAALASLVLPSLTQARLCVFEIKCRMNLRQLAAAAQMYWTDHNDCFWRYYRGAFNNGTLYWFGWIERGQEGARRFDPSQGVLYPYLGGQGVQICPSLKYSRHYFKYKATSATYGYGYNIKLSVPLSEPCRKVTELENPTDIALFADAAQINTFQPPASPDRPMLEEFYYISPIEPTTHFRHRGRAMVLCCDGHVEGGQPELDLQDRRLAGEILGVLNISYFPRWAQPIQRD